MANNVSGSIRSLTLGGLTFDVEAEGDVTEIGSSFENSSIPTSGDNIRVMKKRSENREGFAVKANGDEFEQLGDIADNPEEIEMNYKLASGDVYRTTGWINVENRTTQNIIATVTLFPKNKFELFKS